MNKTVLWITVIGLAIAALIAIENPDARSQFFSELHSNGGGTSLAILGGLLVAASFRSRRGPPSPEAKRQETRKTIRIVAIWIAAPLVAAGAFLLYEHLAKAPSQVGTKPPSRRYTALFPLKKSADGQFGYVDLSGNYAIHPQFHDAYPFSEGVAVVGTALRKYGFIDPSGRLVIDPQFVSAADFHEGLTAICNTQRLWGFIDLKGLNVIPPRFEEVRGFRNGVALVEAGGKWGLIDMQGHYIVQPIFDQGPNGWPGSSDLSEGPIAVVVGHLTGYLGTDGHFVINPKFRAASGFFEGVAAVSVDNRTWGYIAEDGSSVIQPTLDYAEDFHEGFAAIKAGNKWGFIDHSGKIVIPPLYTRVRAFAEGLAAVQIDHRWGYVDQRGVVVISPQFWSDDYAQNEGGDWSFHNGAAEVFIAGKARGYINYVGRVIAHDGK